MCLAVPGQILSISNEDELFPMGNINFSGIQKNISLAYLPEASINDYVIVHAGFAIAIIDEQEAQESLQAFADLKDFDNS